MPELVDERRPRLLIADEHRLFRDAIKVAFEIEGIFSVVAEAGDATGAAAEAFRVEPDLVLLSATLLPGDDALEVSAAIKMRLPKTKVVVRGRSSDQTTFVRALESGADGFMNEDLELRPLIEGIRSVLEGHVFVPPNMLGDLLRDLLAQRGDDARLIQLLLRLTPREREVLDYLVRGCDHLAIASSLSISRHTARTHIQHVVEKLGAHSRQEAVAIAAESGWFDHSVVKS